MMHKGLADLRFLSRAGEDRKKTDTVLCGRVWQRGGEDVSAGGEKVDLADECVAHRTRGDSGWPPGDERDPMTAFIDVGLGTAQAGLRVVIDCLQFGEIRHGTAPVVRGEDHEGVFI